MSEGSQPEKSIVQEFSLFGKQVAEAIRAAWESEDRKKLQAELAEGLQRFETEVNQALDKAGQSDAAKQLREQADKVVADVKESKVTEDARKGVIAGLEVLNQELGKLVDKLESKTVPAAEAEPAESAAPESPSTPAEPVQEA